MSDLTEPEKDYLPVRFLKATPYNADGNEITVPRCEKCGAYKNQLIGKESFIWICQFCPGEQ